MNKTSLLRRRAVLVATIAVAGLTAVPAIHSVAQTLRPTVNVMDYGAVGDGATNDTAAIQKANDAVAARGAGVVFFPAGTYIAGRLRQDSNVEFTANGDATLRHPDGVSNFPIVTGRVFRKLGSIVEGSGLLSVPDTRGVLPGAVVGLRAAGGASPIQYSNLSVSIAAKATSITTSYADGWGRGPAYLLIDNEVVAYSGLSGGTFLNVQRGALGTRAASHVKGAKVSLLQALYARVTSVGSNWIQLDRVAIQGVRSADIFVGSINMAVTGLTLDGNRAPGGSSNNPKPLDYEYARWVRIESCTIRNGDHGAIGLDKGTSDSVIRNNVLADNGDPAATMGAGIWLFRGSSNNVVEGNQIIGDSNHGIMTDDRSEKATEWDAPSDRNYLVGNFIDIPAGQVPDQPNSAIWVVGSAGNVIEYNRILGTVRGISVTKPTQGASPGQTRGAVVRANTVFGHDTGLYVTGADGWYERNDISGTRLPILARGTNNQYVENWVH